MKQVSSTPNRARALLRALALTALMAAPFASAQTIVDVAAGNPAFSTLVDAVKAADLVDTLSSAGPFTVFAPTNDAFAKIPADQLAAILADKALLTKILTYHVVAGQVMAADVTSLASATTVEGEPITITTDMGGVKINDANVTATDVEASNGVIHVIDTVILPPSVTSPSVQSVVYPVNAVNGSGVSGTVTLDRMGEQTMVTLSLQGTPAGGDHPAHFHAGDCTAMGDVVVPLSNVDGTAGMSSTTVDVPLDTIVQGNHALYVHLSPDQIGTVVSCGEIGGGAPAASSGGM